MATRAGHAPLPTGARRKATGSQAVVGWAETGAGLVQLQVGGPGSFLSLSPFYLFLFSIFL